jgi:hypothetical protein
MDRYLQLLRSLALGGGERFFAWWSHHKKDRVLRESEGYIPTPSSGLQVRVPVPTTCLGRLAAQVGRKDVGSLRQRSDQLVMDINLKFLFLWKLVSCWNGRWL